MQNAKVKMLDDGLQQVQTNLRESVKSADVTLGPVTSLTSASTSTSPQVDRRITRRNCAFDLLIIALLWCASLAVINPRGDFPLNDDWVYGQTVKGLMATGHYHPPGEETTLITNVLWGLLFCLPAGFSYNALRLSTLVMSLLGIFGTYFLMRELRAPRRSAVMAALLLGFNPIYYAMSNTFMTDVPCTAIVVIAALFLVRNLRNGSDLDLFVGTILVVASTLSRQIAVAVPLAFAVAFVLRRGITGRSILRAVTPAVLSLIAMLAFKQWLGERSTLEAWRTGQLLHAAASPGALLRSLVLNTYYGLFYLGWFLLPVLILVMTRITPSHRKKVLAFSIAPIGAVAAIVGRFICLHQNVVMPLAGNVIIRSGIGPLTLRDACELHLNLPSALPVGFWLAVTVAGLVGAAFVSGAVGAGLVNAAPRLRQGKLGDIEAARTFLLLSVVAYLLPCFTLWFFDRYLIMVVPLLAAGIASVASAPQRVSRTTKAVSRLAALALLVVTGLFAVLGTRDYLAWNRVRWEALHDLIGSGSAKAEEIDGGYEFNGLYLYDRSYQASPGKSWWWVRGDKYQIAFGEVPGYKVIREYSYNRWMPPHVGRVVVLQRDAQAPGQECADTSSTGGRSGQRSK
jgi:hypothetical protein